MIRHAAVSIAIAFLAGFAARQAMNSNQFAPADIPDPFTQSFAKREQPTRLDFPTAEKPAGGTVNMPSTRPTTRQIHEAQGELWKASQAIDRAYRQLEDVKARP
jgi:hypothetical protein